MCMFFFSLSMSLKELKNVKPIFMVFCFVFLVFIIAFRGEAGYDTKIYIDYFYDSALTIKNLFKNIFVSRHEPGYLILEFINRKIMNNHVYHFFIIGFLSMFFLFKSLKKYTPFVFIALGLYFLRFFFLRDLNQIRAGVALVIVLYNLDNIHNERTRKFYFYTILGALFHKTALLLIPFYYLNKHINKKRDAKNWILLILFFSFLFSFVNVKEYLNQLIIEVFPSAMSYTQGYLSESGNVFSIIVLYQVVIFIIFLLNEKRLVEKQECYQTLRNMLFFSLLLLFVFNDFAILSSRLSTLFATSEILILSSFLFLFKQKFVIKIFLFAFYAILFYINVFLRLGDNYIFSV